MKNELTSSEVTEIQLTPSEEIRYEKGYVLGNYPAGTRAHLCYHHKAEAGRR